MKILFNIGDIFAPEANSWNDITNRELLEFWAGSIELGLTAITNNNRSAFTKAKNNTVKVMEEIEVRLINGK